MVEPLPTTTALGEEAKGVFDSVLEFGADVGNTVMDIGERAITAKPPAPKEEVPTLQFRRREHVKNEEDFNNPTNQKLFAIMKAINSGEEPIEKYSPEELELMDAVGKDMTFFQQQLTRNQEQGAPEETPIWDSLQEKPTYENTEGLFTDIPLALGKGVGIAGMATAKMVGSVLNAGAAAIEGVSGHEQSYTAKGEPFTFSEQWGAAMDRNAQVLRNLRNSTAITTTTDAISKRLPGLPPYETPVGPLLEKGAEIYATIAIPGMPVTKLMLAKRSKWIKAAEENEDMFVKMYGTAAGRLENESLSGWVARVFMSSTVRSTPEAIIWGDRLANAGATAGNALSTNYRNSFEEGDTDKPGAWIIPVSEMVATVVAPWTLATGMTMSKDGLRFVRNLLHKPPGGSLESRFDKNIVTGMKGLLGQIDRLPQIHKDILRSQLDEIGGVIKRSSGGDLAREEALWGLVSDSIYAPVMQAVRAQVTKTPHKMGFFLDNIFNRGANQDSYTTLRSSQVESTNALVGTIEDLKTKMAASGETMTDDMIAIFKTAESSVDDMRRNLILEDNRRTYKIEDDAALQEAVIEQGFDGLIVGNKSAYLSPRIRETLKRIEQGKKLDEVETAALYREIGPFLADQEFKELSRTTVRAAHDKAQAVASQPYKELGNFKLEGEFVVLKKNDAGDMVDSGERLSPTTMLKELGELADQNGLEESLKGLGRKRLGKEGGSVKKYIKSRREAAVEEMDINEVYDIQGLDREEVLLSLDNGDISADQLTSFDSQARGDLAASDVDVDITMNLEDYQTLRTAALQKARALRGDPTGAGDSRALAYSEMVDTLDQFMDDILPAIKGEDAGKLFEAQQGWKAYKDSWGRNIGGRQVRKNAAGEKRTDDSSLFEHFFNPPEGMDMTDSRAHYNLMFGGNPQADDLLNDSFKRWLEETYIQGVLTPEKLKQIANSKGKAGEVLRHFDDILNMDIDGALNRAEGVAGRKALSDFEVKKLENHNTTTKNRALRELGQELNEVKILNGRTPEAMLHNAGQSGDMQAVHQTLRNLTLPSEGGTIENVRALIANAKHPSDMKRLIREVSFLDAVEDAIIRGKGVEHVAEVGTYGQTMAKRGFDAEALETTLAKNADFWEKSGLYTTTEIDNMRDISSLLTLVTNAPEKVAIKGMPSEMALEGILSRLYAINRGVVSAKFIMAELGIRYFRKQRGKFLHAALMEPAFTKVLHEALIEGRHGTKKFQQRFLNVMISIAARQGESYIELEKLSTEGDRLINGQMFMRPIPEDQQKKLPEIDLRGPDLDSPFGGEENEESPKEASAEEKAAFAKRFFAKKEKLITEKQGEEPGTPETSPAFIKRLQERRKK